LWRVEDAWYSGWMREMADLLERAQKRVGTSLRGKYLLVRVLGVGGMAAVYEATHRNGARVAVKVLHREVAAIPEAKRRFLREGYIANQILHPSVVRIADDDEDADGTVFVVMELLEGRTLESELAAGGGWMSAPRVIAITDALLDVLEAAHAAGVVHRDIKPDNIFLTFGGMKVLDFGIARLADSTNATKTGQMMGTAEFVAPEQAGGHVREIDGRTDLFSIGAMMFTLISGELVHQARTSIEYMVFAATKPARSVFDVMPGIEPGLADVIDVALAFDKEHRWASAKKMQTALRTAAMGTESTMNVSANEQIQALHAEYDRRRAANAQPTLPEVARTRTEPLGSPPSDPLDEEPILLKRKE
jgi:serine/threonine protein kinase